LPVRDGSYDVAVIGAGVFGAWTALHLCRSRLRVALLDAYGAGNPRASSGGESRIIRMGYGADEIYTRSAMRSLELWREFCTGAEPPLFHETGVLWIAPRSNAYTESTRLTLEACGARFEIFDEAELGARYPQMELAAGAWGVFEPESGALMARRAVQAVVDRAVHDGAIFIPEAAAPPGGRRRLDAVSTSAGGALRAAVFVFACGPWLPKVFPELLGKRIVTSRQEAFFFGVPPGERRFSLSKLPVWIDFSDPRGPYGFPDLDGRGVKIALDEHGPPIDPDGDDRLPSPGGLAAARACLAQRFPSLRQAPLVEARVCQYENTSNGDFLIDRHPDFSNVWLLGGGSGHGFKHGPAVGEYITARIADGSPVDARYALASKAETQQRTVY
jgi:glycine/D-amino acid oxidase-like deaminating enzyme